MRATSGSFRIVIGLFSLTSAIVVAFSILAYMKPKSGDVAQSYLARQQLSPAQVLTDTIIPPLPKIGGGPTPDGTACCIYGMVWFNGQPVVGADVTIQSVSGTVNLVTENYGDITTSERRPFYLASLYDPPLSTPVGSVITLTARYSGYSKVITHTVLEQDQQVDIAIPRTAPGVLGFASDIRGTSNFTNLVSYPWRITSDRFGRIYVADIVAARIKVFDTNKNLLREWGDYGNQQNQFGRFSAIAVDHQDNVFVVDGDNKRVVKFTSDGTPLSSFSLNCKGCPTFANTSIVIKPNNNILVNSSHLGSGQLAEFSPSGALITSTNNGNLDSSASVYGAGIDVDASGNLFVADPRNNRVLKLDPVTRKPIAGDPWNSLTISNPIDVLVAPNNLIYVSRDTDAGATIESYNASASFQHSIPITILAPLDITYVNGSLFLADGYGGKIIRLDAVLTTSETWIGNTRQQSGAFGQPSGLAVVNDDVLVADCNTSTLTSFRGNAVTKVWPANELGFDTGHTSCIKGLEQDTQGRLLTLNGSLKKLHRFSLVGDAVSVSETFTITNTTYPWQFAIGTSNQTSNTVFIADFDAGRVLVYEIRSNQLVPITATSVITGSGPGQFLSPTDVAVAQDDSVFVVDRNNNRLNKLRFQAGQLQYIGAYTATNSITPLNLPEGVGISPANGHVFVADRARTRVVEVDFSGTTASVVRTYGENLSSQVAPGSMLVPNDVVFDNTGRMYVLQSGAVAPAIFTFNPMTETRPVAAIAHLSLNAGSLHTSSTLTVTGIGQTSDISRTIITYEWTFTSPITNAIQFTTTTSQLIVPASQLLPRIQFVSLRVQDSTGEWSPRAISNLQIYKSTRTPATSSPTVTPGTPPTPKPGVTPSPISCPELNWLMMVYASVDNPDDGEQLLSHLNDVLSGIGKFKNSCVRVAVQMDGPRSITSTVADTTRWFGEPGQPLQKEPLAEQQMDQRSTLRDFVRWAQDKYQARYNYLAITNHGQGILGTGWDFSTNQPTSPLGANDGSYYLRPSDIALALTDSAILPIDTLHLDSCSMGLFDVAYELRHSAKYLIASQYLGWAVFGYDDYLQAIVESTEPKALAQEIVRRYSSAVSDYKLPYTLSAIDLARADQVKERIDKLAVLLKSWAGSDVSLREQLMDLREQSQPFNSNIDMINSPADVYIDVLDWTRKLQGYFTDTIAHQDISAAANRLVEILSGPDSVILINRSGDGALPSTVCQSPLNCTIQFVGANGISLYYPPEALQPPTRTLHSSVMASGVSTTFIAHSKVFTDYVSQNSFEFTRSSRWDEFLSVVLVGRPETAQDQIVIPPQRAPEFRVYLPIIGKPK
jgi:sugar lactone lactonase YvrE